MSDPRAFVTRMRELTGETPGQLVAMWRFFVDDVEDGYTLGIDEYEHDLRIREVIARVLADPVLNEMDELGWVRAEIAEIDDKFRTLQSDSAVHPGLLRPWWWARYPRRAGEALARDVRDMYGIETEVG